MVTHSSESQFKLNFNKEINKIIFHDLYIMLSKTDFERRFFNFQIKQMGFIFENMEKQLNVKNIFDFSGLGLNTISQLLEQVFIETGQSLSTFPISSIRERKHFSSTLSSYEKKLIEFNTLFGKVNVNDEYSFEFLKIQFSQLRKDIYIDLFFYKIINCLNSSNENEKISLIYDFFKLTFLNMFGVNVTDDDLKHAEKMIDFKENYKKIIDYKDMINRITEIIEEVESKKNLKAGVPIIFDEEKLIIDFFSIVSKASVLNIEEEIIKYFFYRKNITHSKTFTENLLFKDFEFQWFVPCHIAYIESSIITKNVGILKENILLKKLSELPQTLNIKNDLLDNNHDHYFHCNISSKNFDLHYSIAKVKKKASEMIDIMYFQETLPFKTTFNWSKAFCIVSDENKKYNIVQNGYNLKYSFPLDNDHMLEKIEFYEKIQTLKSDLIDNDLFKRFLYSLNLYKEVLLLESKEDKILKLWNILEVITKQDKLVKIVEYSAYFPATYLNEIFSKKEILKLSEEKKSEFFRTMYSNYKEIISDIGSLRNEFIAHKNKGIVIQEHRYERSLELLSDIVIKIQHSIINSLHDHQNIGNISSVKEIIKDIKKVYLIAKK